MQPSEAMQRCWAEIDLDALRANYLSARRLSGGMKVICVLKGDAYGLGAAQVCAALRACGADCFAVACGDEAEALPGDVDVLILGRVGQAQAVRLIRRGAIFTLYSPEYAETLIRAAKQAGAPARVHVKLDTGLHRLGFDGPGAVDEIAALHESEWLRMEGLFTHLALHDRAGDLEQFARFDAVREALAARGVTFPMAHVADSIGMLRYPDHPYDAVRTGAWLYGNCPPRDPHRQKCRPVVSLHARIAQIHDVARGEKVGYDDVHTLPRDSRIATLSAGYLDCVPRLNNAGFVEIEGRRAPVVGLVCMDQMMVDVTDIPGAAEGGQATLLGGGITLEEFAAWGGFNRNEALGRIGPRVPRIYRGGN